MSVMNTGKLQVTTPSDREIVMSRQFNAPRELVFRAHAEPDLIAKWWGQRDSETVVDTLDFRQGGGWRFVQRTPDGAEHVFFGEFREIVPPERFTWTFEYEGMPGHVLVETISFEEHDGVTTLTSTSVFDTVEERDTMLQVGMADGAAESLDRLEELLATLG